jgi:hypothetical protein
MVVAAEMSAPSVRFGDTPFSHAEPHRLCGPLPVWLSSAELASPVTTTTCSLKGASGLRIGDNSKLDPSAPTFGR